MTVRLRSIWHWWVGTIWRPWVVEISAAQIVIASAVLVASDRLYLRVGGAHVDGAFLDEPAHIATALLILDLFPRRWRDPILPWALPASFLIDADHIPTYAFHSYFLTEGLQRPYTHSLTTVVVFLALALIWRRGRTACVGIAVGLVLHFFRDCAEDSHTGVALLWPLSKHGFIYSQNLYLVLMAGVGAAALLRAAWTRAWVPAPLVRRSSG